MKCIMWICRFASFFHTRNYNLFYFLFCGKLLFAIELVIFFYSFQFDEIVLLSNVIDECRHIDINSILLEVVLMEKISFPHSLSLQKYRKKPPLQRSQNKYSGAVFWERLLMEKLKKSIIAFRSVSAEHEMKEMKKNSFIIININIFFLQLADGAARWR